MRKLPGPVSDEGAHRAVAALRVLLSEPNELRELWQETSQVTEWESDIAGLIGALERPRREVPTLGEPPAGPEPDRAQVAPSAVASSKVGADMDAEVFVVAGGWRRKPGWGTWGVDGFANDAASRWIAGFDPGRGYRELREAVNRVWRDVDAPTAQRAVAAAGIMALCRGSMYVTTPEVTAFVSRVGHPPSDEDAHRAAAAFAAAAQRAERAVRVMAGDAESGRVGDRPALLIGDLEQPPIELPESDDTPGGPEPDAGEPGNSSSSSSATAACSTPRSPGDASRRGSRGSSRGSSIVSRAARSSWLW